MDKPLYSALPPDVIKAILLVSLADGIVALSYGSLAGSLGFPLWVPLALSLLVMAGASEFIFIGMVAGEGARWLLLLPGYWSMPDIFRLVSPCVIWWGMDDAALSVVI